MWSRSAPARKITPLCRTWSNAPQVSLLFPLRRQPGCFDTVPLLPKIKVEVIVSRISVDAVVEAAKKALYTGHIGDGKIFVYNVTRVVKIRTGEEDYAALQDVE